MKRAELIKNLQEFRDAWNEQPQENADLGDSLEAESTENLRELIKWHYAAMMLNNLLVSGCVNNVIYIRIFQCFY